MFAVADLSEVFTFKTATVVVTNCPWSSIVVLKIVLKF